MQNSNISVVLKTSAKFMSIFHRKYNIFKINVNISLVLEGGRVVNVAVAAERRGSISAFFENALKTCEKSMKNEEGTWRETCET